MSSSFTDALEHREQFNLLRQNLEMASWGSQLLVTQANTNLGTAVKTLCRYNSSSNSIDFKIWKFIQVGIADKSHMNSSRQSVFQTGGRNQTQTTRRIWGAIATWEWLPTDNQQNRDHSHAATRYLVLSTTSSRFSPDSTVNHPFWLTPRFQSPDTLSREPSHTIPDTWLTEVRTNI